MQQFRSFLSSLTGPAWLCAAVAAAGLALSIYSWLAESQTSYVLSYLSASLAMFSGFIGFASVMGQQMIAWDHRPAQPPAVTLPRVYWITASLSGTYFVAVFLGGAAYDPHGVDLGPVVLLRVFSAGTLFFGMFSLGFTQWAGLRARALQSSS